MPRWISLLSLALLVLAGGTAAVWAEAAPAVGVHDTVPPAEAESSDAEEEATTLGETASAAPLVPVFGVSAVSVRGWTHQPPIRPPR